MSSGPPRPTLEEARRRLRELGYLQGPVERFVFRRAIVHVSGLVVPVVAAIAAALAAAETAAVASSQFRYGDRPAPLFFSFSSSASSRSCPPASSRPSCRRQPRDRAVRAEAPPRSRSALRARCSSSG